MSKIDRGKFLELFFGQSLEENGGFIEIREFGVNGHPVIRRFHDNIQYIKDYIPDGNLFFGVCPRQIKGNGKKESIKFISALWCDMDYGSDGHKKESQFTNYQEALGAVKAFQLQPSIVVDSGHGLHVYWLLKKPEEVDQVYIEKILKGISTRLGGDTTYDISRILRLPDSKNLKIPDNPKDVKVVLYSPDKKYCLTDFEFLKAPGKKKVKTKSGGKDMDIDQLPGISQEVRELIKQGKQENDKYESRSEADYRVICHLVKMGYSDVAIRKIFENYPIGEKFREQGDAYLIHSISHARDDVERQNQQNDIRELLDAKYLHFNSTKVADRIIANKKIIYCGSHFFEYWSGCYRKMEDAEVKRWIMEIVGNSLSKKKMDEIFTFLITKTAKRPSELNNTDKINLKNGLFDINDFRLHHHNPEIYSTIQLDVEYDPQAKCELWLKTLNEIFPEEQDKIQTLQEFFGLCLTRETKYEKALILTGDGANGKSLTLNVLQALVGGENCSAVYLEQFNNRFYVAEFLGKLVNVSIETNAKLEVYDSIFKAVVSGDTLGADCKFKQPFKFRPFCKLVFAMNNLPRVSDKTSAYFRRLLIIRFNREFGEEEQNKMLFNELRKELNGIFNWCLDGLKRLMARGYFEIGRTMKDEIEQYKRENNNILLFADERCDFMPWYHCSTADLYSDYARWCKESGHYPLSKIMFGKEIRRQFKELTELKNAKERGLKGICLKAREYIPI